jgi:predicted transposase YbfD/YdcC
MSTATKNGPQWKQARYSADSPAYFDEVCRREMETHEQYVFDVAKEMSRPNQKIREHVAAEHDKFVSDSVRRKQLQRLKKNVRPNAPRPAAKAVRNTAK